MRPGATLALVLALLALPVGVTGATGAGTAADALQVLAPGYLPLTFEAPPPGSYTLDDLGLAADGEVLDSSGRPRALATLLAGKLTVLSFIYSHCNDVNGCPLSTAVLYRVQRAIARDPALAGRAQVLSLSFDPARDTPAVMARYGAGFRLAGGADVWSFLTTRSERELQPILSAYGQEVRRELGADGTPSGVLAHILRVFLIDAERRIRNIYSVAFLHADVVLNDLLTVAAEGPSADPGVDGAADTNHGAGDDRSDYEHADYQTRSRSLAARQGQPLDLVRHARTPQLGLAPPPGAEQLDARRVQLGRKLFFDRRLSLNQTFSCAMCHIPEQGFTSHELATAVGIEGRTVRRNAPTLYNVAYLRRLFHDAREHTLEQQVWSPLLAANEMGNPSIGHVLETLRSLDEYAGLFEAAFAGRAAGMETVGQALAAYQRTLVNADSPFDRWHYGGLPDTMSPAARRGFELFTGRAGCAACHTLGQRQALFTDEGLHNTGIGYRRSMGDGTGPKRIQLAPGVFVDVDRAAYEAAAEKPPSDLGRYEITQDPADRWRYRTPGLRNVALTAPYMHDGSLATLADVVAFYDAGGVPNPLLDPRIRALHLGATERADLVAFLESLTGSATEALIGDAFAAPVGDRVRP